jgi:hypothetical protein
MRLTLRARQVVARGFVVLLVVVVSTIAHLANVARLALGAAAAEGPSGPRWVTTRRNRRARASASRWCIAIVQMHDGRIDVDSEVDRGTAMILTLPVASGTVQP